MKVRPANVCSLFKISSFNSRTCEGATGKIMPDWAELQFQFTHLWRCDFLFCHIVRLWYVSIHAPVKVRQNMCFTYGVLSMFQFTHLWRCDVYVILKPGGLVCFNSRTCEGATRALFFCWLMMTFQFTHLWRCDSSGGNTRSNKRSFNSRTCEGATLVLLSLFLLFAFQFTHLWRCDYVFCTW